MSQSHIQRQIISQLKNADYKRYSELRPVGIDRDLFNYHLRELVKNGLLDKPQTGQYRLSAKGRRQVADVQHTSDTTNRLFKINPLLIVLDRRDDGIYVLNQRRTAQPSYGIVGIPGGTIIKEEPLLDGAIRKLREETGLNGTFEYLMTTRRIVYRSDALFSDVLFPICLATSWAGQPITTEYGENYWVPIDQAIANDSERNDHIAAIGHTLRAIRDDKLGAVRGQYTEQTLRLDTI